MPGRDVYADVLALLTPQPRKLLDIIEDHFGRQVQFLETTLPCGARGNATWGNNQPIVRLSPWDGDLAVITHELLHLKRRVEGHPWIRNLHEAREREHITTGLYNLIDEVAFDEEFVRLGFDPLHGLEQVVHCLLNTLEAQQRQRYQVSEDSDRLLAAAHAWVFLRARNAPSAPAFLRSLDGTQHARAKRWGEALARAVRAADFRTPGGTARLSDECAQGILGMGRNSYELKDCPRVPR